jgi:hypothetical protein
VNISIAGETLALQVHISCGRSRWLLPFGAQLKVSDASSARAASIEALDEAAAAESGWFLPGIDQGWQAARIQSFD